MQENSKEEKEQIFISEENIQIYGSYSQPIEYEIPYSLTAQVKAYGLKQIDIIFNSLLQILLEMRNKNSISFNISNCSENEIIIIERLIENAGYRIIYEESYFWSSYITIYNDHIKKKSNICNLFGLL